MVFIFKILYIAFIKKYKVYNYSISSFVFIGR